MLLIECRRIAACRVSVLAIVVDPLHRLCFERLGRRPCYFDDSDQGLEDEKGRVLFLEAPARTDDIQMRCHWVYPLDVRGKIDDVADVVDGFLEAADQVATIAEIQGPPNFQQTRRRNENYVG